MTIVRCPECLQTVSDTAAQCPHCGFAVAKYFQERANRAPQPAPKLKTPPSKKSIIKGKFMVGAIIAFVPMMCVCAGIVGSMGSRDDAKQREEQKRRIEQQAKARQDRIAKTIAKLPQHEKSLKESLASGNIANAQHLIKKIAEAKPNHPLLADSKKQLRELKEAKVRADLLKQSSKMLEQAKIKTKAKKYIEANDIYEEIIEGFGSIPADKLSEEEGQALKAALKEQKRIASRVAKEQKKIERARKDAAEKKKRCGGTNCMETTASKLCREYAANEVRADNKWRGQTIVITGRVTDISKDLFDNVQFGLRTPSRCPFGIHAPIPDYQSSDASKIDKGDKVTLRCKVIGMTLGSPHLSKCILVEYWT